MLSLGVCMYLLNQVSRSDSKQEVKPESKAQWECLECSPVKPSLVVGGQDGIWASLLEAADEGLQVANSPSDELGTA